MLLQRSLLPSVRHPLQLERSSSAKNLFIFRCTIFIFNKGSFRGANKRKCKNKIYHLLTAKRYYDYLLAMSYSMSVPIHPLPKKGLDFLFFN